MSERLDDREQQELLTRLERELPRVTPPESLFGEVRAQIAPEAVPVVPSSSRPARRRTRLVALLAGATLAATALTVVLLDTGDSPDTIRAALVGHRGDGVHGEVALLASASDRGRVGLEIRDLPPAPSGHHYTVWVLRTGSEQMTPVGSFSTASELELPLPGPASYAALDISLQRDDAPPTHSGISVAGASFG